MTRIYSSVAGELLPEWPVSRGGPFHALHHTISHAGLVGSGRWPRPGEISLVHRGVLFLDELPEFGQPALDALRQVLANGVTGEQSQVRTGPSRIGCAGREDRRDRAVPLLLNHWSLKWPIGVVLHVSMRWRESMAGSRVFEHGRSTVSTPIRAPRDLLPGSGHHRKPAPTARQPNTPPATGTSPARFITAVSPGPRGARGPCSSHARRASGVGNRRAAVRAEHPSRPRNLCGHARLAIRPTEASDWVSAHIERADRQAVSDNIGGLWPLGRRGYRRCWS